MIENYDPVMGERVSRTEYDYTYTADLMNLGPALQNVVATVTSTSPDTVVVDGTLSFGNVPAKSRVISHDTFTIRQNRLVPFDLSVLVWEIQAEPALITIVETSPSNGEGDVAVTRETIIRFSWPLSASTVVNDNVLFAEFGGRRLPTRIHISFDRRTLTLFYQNPLPASARVRVTLVGDWLFDEDGRPADADGDGLAGGVAIIDFETLSLTTLTGTAVVGRVFASELAPGESNMSVNVPLQGVTITVDGMEDTLRTVTDEMGNFRLEPAPAGRFFVHIDGRTATNGVPEGAYYPFVGKAWESVPGEEVNVGNIYLPLVVPGTLQPVSTTADTEITFPSEVLAEHPELEGVSITIPADSLYADDGTRGGQVGIAPVPPDRLPGELPEGLEFPVVITVQTDGATNFDVPVPVCFPNLPDAVTGEPLPSGAKNALFSFNHDTGEWEHVGPMAVSGDGQLVCTDPGIGIRAPGWHGSGPPPSNPPPPPPPCRPNPEKIDCVIDCFDRLWKMFPGSWRWGQSLAS
ncbi:Ig-like domain-containing protein [Candidatus Poribacteria bacterium]|nr:Ig-like domain-containing protein [Candidatus Poribacteria bacterium]